MASNNVGWRDAGIRGFVAGLLLLGAAALQGRPLVSLGIGFIGIMIAGTALFRVCPLYALLGISTCDRVQAKPR